jgi:HD-GYP domain
MKEDTLSFFPAQKGVDTVVLWERFCAMPQLMMEHSVRVGAAVRVLLSKAAQPMDMEMMSYAAMWHDIGKSLIPYGILQKKAPLGLGEWALLRSHTEFGAEILADLLERFPENAPIHSLKNVFVDVALCHHERWDGCGYPHGMKGKEIPFMARVVALADSVDAMYNPRTYSVAKSKDDIEYIISDGCGTQFDPEIVALFEEEKKNVFEVVSRPSGELMKSFRKMWRNAAATVSSENVVLHGQMA